jgi:ribonuclease D
LPIQYRYIDTQADWDAVADTLARAPQLALDTERNGRFAYRERICLIQVSDGNQTYLVDPLAVKNFASFGELLSNESIVKVIHGSEEDIRFFDRDYGFAVENLFDTGQAARFLGVTRPNLGAVLEEFAGVAISKDRKLQMSHWGLRPLSRAALDYAAGDVQYLLPLADELRYRLQKTNRLEWVQEECERLQNLRYPPEEPLDTAYRRVRGWDSLSPREAAILQELYAFRDDKACMWDVPPTIASSNDDLLQLAQSNGQVPHRLGGMLGVRCYGELIEAIERGFINPEIPKPPRSSSGEDWTPERRNRLNRLKGWRAFIGEELELAVNHIWPTGSLERIALHPGVMERELAGGDGEVRHWQRAEFGSGLEQFVRSMDR